MQFNFYNCINLYFRFDKITAKIVKKNLLFLHNPLHMSTIPKVISRKNLQRKFDVPNLEFI